MADSNLSAMLKQLQLNPELIKAVPALVARYGTASAVALARGYLGPLAPIATKDDAAAEAPPNPEAAPAADGTPRLATSTGRASSKLSSADSALLGLALTKLVYELGELALHNPSVDPKGKQPEFKVDAHGRAPALSVTHVVAVARVIQAYRADAKAAEAAAAPPPTNRARLQAARTERYAASPRHPYVARPVTYRALR